MDVKHEKPRKTNSTQHKGMGKDFQAGFGSLLGTNDSQTFHNAKQELHTLSVDAPGEKLSWKSLWQGWDLFFHPQIESLPRWALTGREEQCSVWLSERDEWKVQEHLHVPHCCTCFGVDLSQVTALLTPKFMELEAPGS